MSVLELVYDLSKTFIFHNDWELRHGALIYMRAFSRVFKTSTMVCKLPESKMSESDLRICCQLVHVRRMKIQKPKQGKLLFFFI